ncbi:MAG: hypothetical protein AAF846_24280, partial [Chloroflexota bacterium]
MNTLYYKVDIDRSTRFVSKSKLARLLKEYGFDLNNEKIQSELIRFQDKGEIHLIKREDVYL